MASASRDSDFPPGLFGTWITAAQPAWASDYHQNYNHQAPFYALYSANRIEQAEPYYPPLLAFIPRARYYSEKVTNIPGGILLPVGIGPLGIETTRWTPLMEKYRQAWKTGGNIEDQGMFWKQRSNAAYAAVNLSMQFYHPIFLPIACKKYRVYPLCVAPGKGIDLFEPVKVRGSYLFL